MRREGRRAKGEGRRRKESLRPLSFLLLPFSVLYGTVMWLRNIFYRFGIFSSWQAPVPVISVGNLSAGGTGKTPVAASLLNFYVDKGIRVAYLSRGYGRRSKGYFQVPSDGEASMYGDEACQIAASFPSLPVAVSKSRKIGIQRLVSEEKAEMIVLDDAFQHRAVARDMDIVVMDANRPFWSDMLLPAGRLREFVSGLKRADVFVVNKVRSDEQIQLFQKQTARYQKPIFFCQPTFTEVVWFDGDRRMPASGLRNQAIFAFAGIGNPDFFFQQLERIGVKLVGKKTFRDHYVYQQGDIDSLGKQLKNLRKGTLLLTTEKDYFRLRKCAWIKEVVDLPLVYVGMELEWRDDNKQLDDILSSLI